MNERIQELALQASKEAFPTGSVAWMEVFAELIVRECCNRLSKETIRHDGYGYNQHELYRRLREHFGVES